MKLPTFVFNLQRRFAALFDGSAWLLILPALCALYLWDAPMVKTLGQWSLYFLVLAGVVVMISRIVFPTVHLPTFIGNAERGDLAGALVTAAVILFVGMLVLSFVLWARPVGT